jgi:hypothetical protein
MILKLLGGFDLIIGIIFIFGAYKYISAYFLLVFILLLIIKSSLDLWTSPASWIDALCAIIFLWVIFFPLSFWIAIILGILIGQKGIISFLSQE